MKTKRIVIVVISIILLLFGCWKKEAAVNSEIQTVKKLSMENPYKNMEKSVNDKDVYARGKHVTITKKEMKKEGKTDPLYEMYGGAQKYEDDMREVTRKNLSIEQYMNNLREEYVKESGEETGMGDFDQKWYEKRKEIEQKFVKAEEIHKVK